MQFLTVNIDREARFAGGTGFGLLKAHRFPRHGNHFLADAQKTALAENGKLNLPRLRIDHDILDLVEVLAVFGFCIGANELAQTHVLACGTRCLCRGTAGLRR